MNFSEILVSPWIYIPLFYVSWVILFLLMKSILFRFLKRVTQYTSSPIDDIFLEAARFPVVILIFASGGVVVEKMLPWANPSANSFLLVFKAMTIVAAVIFVERFMMGLIRIYSERIDILRSSGAIAKGTLRAIIYALGLLALMDSFGISITPALASLGIGSLAVALSLQPTMENFFAGIQLVVDKQIQVGQFIKLESGEEGYVHSIGWRSTWVRLLPNHMVIIPNKILTNTRITNYDYPEPEVAVLVEVGVHYSSDLDFVEKVTLEVAREVMKDIKGGVENFAPLIRYHNFADFSINFTVVLRAREFVDGYLIKHEFIKRLHKRYAKEGIIIPYPIEAVNLTQEEAAAQKYYKTSRSAL